MRTLEQKIADAGPNHQRINPHILTRVRNQMLKEGSLQKIEGSPPWYALASADPKKVTERLAILKPLQAKLGQKALTTRIGQTLEIAAYRALLKSPLEFFGAYTDLDDHDDSKLYKKEEPPSTISGRTIGAENLDFIARLDRVTCGIEIKNIREWLYPDRHEVRDAIRKCLTLDIVPVLLARRIPYVTFRLLSPLGVIIHQQYNQLLPASEATLATQVRDKTLLGYHDIRTGNEPDARMMKFCVENLPKILEEARERYLQNKDLLEQFAGGMDYAEFAARVRRREAGTNEDHDWPQEEPEADPNDFEFD
jgi:hypothetical protein